MLVELNTSRRWASDCIENLFMGIIAACSMLCNCHFEASHAHKHVQFRERQAFYDAKEVKQRKFTTKSNPDLCLSLISLRIMLHQTTFDNNKATCNFF